MDLGTIISGNAMQVDPAQTQDWGVFTYDAADRLLTAENGNSKVTRVFDAAGRLKTDRERYKDLNGGTNRELGYEYLNNRVSRSNIPTGGYDFRFGYDGQGRLETVTHNEALAGVVDYRYFYNRASSVTRRYNYYNGSEVNYVYDRADRITDVDLKRPVNNVATLFSHEHYTLDAMNRVTAIVHQQGGTTTDNFAYDAAGQLKSAAYGWPNPMGNCTYNWDNAGNRLSAGGKSYTPNAYNQYTAVGTSATPNADGIHNGSEHEIDQYKAMIYKYYGDTYLSKVIGGGTTYELFYDALGRCVERKTNGVARYYLYDGEHWIQEYLADGTSYSGVVYGLGIDEVLGRGVNGVPHWPLPDRNGNIAVVTSSMTGSGSTLTTTILEQYRYDAFGTPTVFTGGGTKIDSSAIGNRFLFTGREYNSLFGFYEYRARAYHPGLGRFMSEDPKGFDAGDYNFYRYCENDPWDETDPMGLTGGDQKVVGIPPSPSPYGYGLVDKFDQLRQQQNAASDSHAETKKSSLEEAGKAGGSRAVALAVNDKAHREWGGDIGQSEKNPKVYTYGPAAPSSYKYVKDGVHRPGWYNTTEVNGKSRLPSGYKKVGIYWAFPYHSTFWAPGDRRSLYKGQMSGVLAIPPSMGATGANGHVKYEIYRYNPNIYPPEY